jgi:NADH-quinone oxidoreductase subunit L
VIHALSGEQDIRKMGGLWKRIPKTYWVFLIGTAAIAGFPFLAGWWSKDEILGHAFTHGHYLFWFFGAAAALLTAFYMSRLLYVTFYGESRLDHDVAHHVHESPMVMLGPLFVLAALSVVGGLVGVIPGGLDNGMFHQFLSPVLRGGEGAAAEHHDSSLPYILMAVTTLIAFLGWFLAHYLYAMRPGTADIWAAKAQGAYRTLLNKYYVDELYDMLVVEPTKRLGLAWDWFDRVIIDGLVRWVGHATEAGAAGSTWVEKYIIYGFLNVIGYGNHLAARSWRRLQSGMVHHYAAIIVAGLFLLVHLVWLLWGGSSGVGVALK